MPPDEWQRRPLSRRRFLAASGAAALLAAAGCSSERTTPGGGSDDEPILIVGAGLAGLTAAYRLHQGGRAVMVHEASDRIGGRVRTVSDFSSGRTIEAGGEFVNSDHHALRNLADELGLAEQDTFAAYPDGTAPLAFFDGERYPFGDLFDDWRAVGDAVARDFTAAGPDVRAGSHTPAAARLDRRSLAEWVETEVPGGIGSNLGRFLALTYEGEFGCSVEELSSLALIETMGPTAADGFDPLGGSDERWQIVGGNESVVRGLAEAIPSGSVVRGSRLVALRAHGGGVTASFDSDRTTADISADRVVLALPFPMLNTVDLSGSGLSETKIRVVGELGMGSNAKLHLEHGERAWYEAGLDGGSSSDTSLGITWEESIAQDGDAGLLVAFTGGERGASYPATTPHGEAPVEVVEEAKRDEAVVFGRAVAAQATGNARLDSWVHDPFSGGSYSCWKVGQYTRIRGVEGQPEPPFHFCGEHTSLHHQGYMNGAVESGERVAAEILG